MKVSKAIFTRRTIRRFKQRPIRFSILKELVDAARLAPSAANLQPVEFVIIDKDSIAEKVFPHLRWAGYIAPLGNPPEGKRPVCYIAVLLNEQKARMEFACYDVAAGIMNIILLAWERHIGSCWIKSFDEPPLRKLLKVPPYIKIDSIIALGYKDESPAAEEIDGFVKYWKDNSGILHVPKRSLKKILHHNTY